MRDLGFMNPTGAPEPSGDSGRIILGIFVFTAGARECTRGCSPRAPGRFGQNRLGGFSCCQRGRFFVFVSGCARAHPRVQPLSPQAIQVESLQTSNPCATTRKRCNRPNFVAKGSSYHEIAFVGNGCKKSRCNKNLQPLLVWRCKSQLFLQRCQALQQDVIATFIGVAIRALATFVFVARGGKYNERQRGNRFLLPHYNFVA